MWHIFTIREFIFWFNGGGFDVSQLSFVPNIPMSTAGSLEGICCRNGRISSITNHLSKYSRIFPRQTREFTLTCRGEKNINFSNESDGSLCLHDHVTETDGERGRLQTRRLDPRDERVLHGGVIDQVGEGRDDVQTQLLIRKTHR